ncbi:hypothetical protein GJA_4314 [Janthinobacterium agaricidamnosum NBRC 102515 = DSM 9628]|uniref:Uncharacterized protein n=1 Tax=Janthinobacterium agaricidamnosum NBRC 102515 = DSM 9628 TaxID=1349767 RepID=W0VC91_9BURK|nr:hypothetical protein GJA_4314 [Janthinobacterium agaricidamnosum NBRC 102515 = DSM 9628]
MFHLGGPFRSGIQPALVKTGSADQGGCAHCYWFRFLKWRVSAGYAVKLGRRRYRGRSSRRCLAAPYLAGGCLWNDGKGGAAWTQGYYSLSKNKHPGDFSNPFDAGPDLLAY